jgi:hypothetical protein
MTQIYFEGLDKRPVCYGSSIPDNTYFTAGDIYLWHKKDTRYFTILPEGILLKAHCDNDTPFFEYMKVEVSITVTRAA